MTDANAALTALLNGTTTPGEYENPGTAPEYDNPGSGLTPPKPLMDLKRDDSLGGIFGRKFEAGQLSTAANLRAAQAGFKKLIGQDEEAEGLLDTSRMYQSLSTNQVKDLETFAEFLDQPTFGGFVKQAVGATGNVLPSVMNTMASAAGVAAITATSPLLATPVATAAGVAAVTANVAQKATVGLASTAVAKKLIKDSIRKKVIKAATPAENALADVSFQFAKAVAIRRGAITGAAASEYPQMTGANLLEAVDDAGQDFTKEQVLRAGAVAVPQTVIGVGAEAVIARNLAKAFGKVAAERAAKSATPKGEVTSLLQRFSNSVPGEIAKTGLKSGALEGTAETLQEGIGAVNRFSLDDTYTNEEARLRLAESAFAGFMAGKAVGVTGGTLSQSARFLSKNVAQKASDLINGTTEQQVQRQYNTEIYGNPEGITDPELEPDRDLIAQVGAIAAADSTIDSMWLVKGQQSKYDSELENVKEHEITEVADNLFAVKTPEGTLLTTDKRKAKRISNASIDFNANGNRDILEVEIADALGYTHTKAELNPEPDNQVVVRAVSKNGSIIREQVTDIEKADEVEKAAAGWAYGEGSFVERADIPEVLQRRRQERRRKDREDAVDAEFEEIAAPAAAAAGAATTTAAPTEQMELDLEEKKNILITNKMLTSDETMDMTAEEINDAYGDYEAGNIVGDFDASQQGFTERDPETGEVFSQTEGAAVSAEGALTVSGPTVFGDGSTGFRRAVEYGENRKNPEKLKELQDRFEELYLQRQKDLGNLDVPDSINWSAVDPESVLSGIDREQLKNLSVEERARLDETLAKLQAAPLAESGVFPNMGINILTEAINQLENSGPNTDVRIETDTADFRGNPEMRLQVVVEGGEGDTVLFQGAKKSRYRAGQPLPRAIWIQETTKAANRDASTAQSKNHDAQVVDKDGKTTPVNLAYLVRVGRNLDPEERAFDASKTQGNELIDIRRGLDRVLAEFRSAEADIQVPDAEGNFQSIAGTTAGAAPTTAQAAFGRLIGGTAPAVAVGKLNNKEVTLDQIYRRGQEAGVTTPQSPVETERKVAEDGRTTSEQFFTEGAEGSGIEAILQREAPAEGSKIDRVTRAIDSIQQKLNVLSIPTGPDGRPITQEVLDRKKQLESQLRLLRATKTGRAVTRRGQTTTVAGAQNFSGLMETDYVVKPRLLQMEEDITSIQQALGIIPTPDTRMGDEQVLDGPLKQVELTAQQRQDFEERLAFLENEVVRIETKKAELIQEEADLTEQINSLERTDLTNAQERQRYEAISRRLEIREQLYSDAGSVIPSVNKGVGSVQENEGRMQDLEPDMAPNYEQGQIDAINRKVQSIVKGKPFVVDKFTSQGEIQKVESRLFRKGDAGYDKAKNYELNRLKNLRGNLQEEQRQNGNKAEEVVSKVGVGESAYYGGLARGKGTTQFIKGVSYSPSISSRMRNFIKSGIGKLKPTGNTIIMTASDYRDGKFSVPQQNTLSLLGKNTRDTLAVAVAGLNEGNPATIVSDISITDAKKGLIADDTVHLIVVDDTVLNDEGEFFNATGHEIGHAILEEEKIFIDSPLNVEYKEKLFKNFLQARDNWEGPGSNPYLEENGFDEYYADQFAIAFKNKLITEAKNGNLNVESMAASPMLEQTTDPGPNLSYPANVRDKIDNTVRQFTADSTPEVVDSRIQKLVDKLYDFFKSMRASFKARFGKPLDTDFKQFVAATVRSRENRTSNTSLQRNSNVTTNNMSMSHVKTKLISAIERAKPANGESNHEYVSNMMEYANKEVLSAKGWENFKRLILPDDTILRRFKGREITFTEEGQQQLDALKQEQGELANRLIRAFSDPTQRRYTAEQVVEQLDSFADQEFENDPSFQYFLEGDMTLTQIRELADQYEAKSREVFDFPDKAVKQKLASEKIDRKTGENIANFFEAPAQSGPELKGKLGFLRASNLRKAKFRNKLMKLANDDLASDEYLKALELAANDETSTESLKESSPMAYEIRKFLEDDVYKNYVLKAKRNAVDIGFTKNFFPRSLDLAAITAQSDQFVDDIYNYRVNVLNENPRMYKPRAKDGTLIPGTPERSALKDDMYEAVENMQKYRDSIDNDGDKSEPDLTTGEGPYKAAQYARSLTAGVPSSVISQFLEPPDVALNTYLNRVVKRVEWNRATRDENGKDLLQPELSKLSEENRQYAIRTIQAYLGYVPKRIPPWLATLNSFGQVFNFVTLLPFATLASLPDLAGIFLNQKDWRGVTAAFKEIPKVMKSGYVELAKDIGLTSKEAIASTLLTQGEEDFMSIPARKVSNAFFTVTGLNLFTNFTRSFAAGMGRQFIIRHARTTVAKDGQQAFDDSVAYLAELGLSQAVVNNWLKTATLDADGDVIGFPPIRDGSSIEQAIQRFAESSIMRPNAAQRPLWANDPRYMLVWQLKAFFYAYGKTILGGIKNAVHNAQERDKRAGGTGAGGIPQILISSSILAAFTLPLTMLGLELREYAKSLLAWMLPGETHLNSNGEWKYLRSDRMDWGEYSWEMVKRSGVLGYGALFEGASTSTRFGDSFLIALAGPSAQFTEQWGQAAFTGNYEDAITRSIPLYSSV